LRICTGIPVRGTRRVMGRHSKKNLTFFGFYRNAQSKAECEQDSPRRCGYPGAITPDQGIRQHALIAVMVWGDMYCPFIMPVLCIASIAEENTRNFCSAHLSKFFLQSGIPGVWRSFLRLPYLMTVEVTGYGQGSPFCQILF
jgi:hypothetical protein